MVWLYLSIAIIAEVIATSALKFSEGFTRPIPSLLVVLGYAGAFYFLSRVLTHIPISIAYAIWSGAGVALVGIVGWVWLGQKLDMGALVGIGLIISGVVVINLFSATVSH
jgi:small multidrug resistance pump